MPSPVGSTTTSVSSNSAVAMMVPVRRNDPSRASRRVAEDAGVDDRTAALHSEHADAPAAPRADGNARLGRRLFSNYFFQMINLGVRLFEQLLIIPLCISAWGTDLYKDWLIIFSIVGLIYWCTFGLDQHFGAKFLHLVALKDHKGLRRQLHVALFICLILTVVVFLGLYGTLFLANIRSLLTLSAMSRHTAIFCLVAMTSPMLLWLTMEILRAMYRAHGDFSRGEYLFALFNGSQITTIVVLLVARQPPTAVAVCYLVLGFLYAGGTMIDVCRRYPAVTLGLAVPTRQELREIVPQSLLYFTNPLSIALTQNAVVLLFGLLNVGALAMVKYNVLRVFTGVTRQIGAQSFAVGGGIEMARQHAQNDIEACRRLYADTGRITSSLVGLLAGLSIPLSVPFVTLWTHGTIPRDTLLVVCLLASIFLSAPGQASMMLLRYSHRPRPIAFASLAHSTVGLALCFLLVPRIGVVGAAIAFMMTEAVAIGVYPPIMVGSLFGFSPVRHLARSHAAGITAFVISFAVATLLFDLPAPNLLSIFVRIAAWAVVVLPPVGLLLVLSRAQRTQVLGAFHRRATSLRRYVAERAR